MSVRMIDIHDRPLQSADSDDSENSGKETEQVEVETTPPPVVGVEQYVFVVG